MKELLGFFEPNLWFRISIFVWMSFFAGMVLWVFRPGGRQTYDETAKRLLNDDD